ncbi:MAG: 2,3-bisphosphoglycerate-independent phosphoglycerate mutase [Bacteroidota bacterium]
MAINKKIILIILDGWGIGDGSESDAIVNSKIPFYDYLLKTYPHSTLFSDGENVGLPEGQMGNSEVGHLNIGAGRVVYQDLVKINKSIREKTIDKNPVLLETFRYVTSPLSGKRVRERQLHLMGLLSPGGIHSHEQHLYKLCDLAKEHGLKNVFIHAFMDGRDCDPRSGLQHITNLEKQLKNSVGKIATICGRYYAMDRDKRWERIKLAYDMLVKGEGEKVGSSGEAVKQSYQEGITDEFIKPVVICKNEKPVATIKEDDAVICFNFRTDRCREITTVLTQENFFNFGMKKISLHYVTMSNYDRTFKNVHVIYDKDDLKMTLGEVLSKHGKKQIRIAETEKYSHVTFFFSGGRENVFKGETRILIPSPKVATYDLKPEMSAVKVTDAILAKISNLCPDFICLNFANPDMVGHTGNYQAVIKAIETVDTCLKKIVNTGIEHGYSFIIIADHGNAEFMINSDDSPNTAHTTNSVPCILIDKDHKNISSGKLADIAPTILKIMDIEIPKEMTGKVMV